MEIFQYQLASRLCVSRRSSIHNGKADLTDPLYISSLSIALHSLVSNAFLSASLYLSKRGAYWDRLYRDVVGRWLVVTRVHCGQTVHPRPSYYGTLIGNSTPGIQWYNFRPPGVTPNRRMGPPWGAFCQLLWPLVCIHTPPIAGPAVWPPTLSVTFNSWRVVAYIHPTIKLSCNTASW